MPIIVRPPDQPIVQYVSRDCGLLTVECIPGPSNNGGVIYAYTASYYRTNQDQYLRDVETVTIGNPNDPLYNNPLYDENYNTW